LQRLHIGLSPFEVADAAKRVSHLVNGAERVCGGLSHVSL
jgi:hypothetical protein